MSTIEPKPVELAETTVHDPSRLPRAIPLAAPLNGNGAAPGGQGTEVVPVVHAHGVLASNSAQAGDDSAGRRPTPSHSAGGDDESADEMEDIEPRSTYRYLRGMGACGFSALVHAVLLIGLGLSVFENPIRHELSTLVATVFEERPEDASVELELERELKPVTEVTEVSVSAAPVAAATIGSIGGTAGHGVAIDQRVFEPTDAPATFNIAPPSLGLPSMATAIETIPDGVLGDPRAIVSNYQEALDRITQEIAALLEKKDVLVIWCFDQSQSMEDDRAEIRDRVNKVYSELGLLSRASGDHLLTAVTSFGQGFQIHTKRPTSDRVTIREAIDSIPNDPSGFEMMCQAVGTAMNRHREFGRKRQMVLILVTDESGDQATNQKYLERALEEARSAHCRVYTLGREAVFGYPYVYMRWQHPDTKEWHWIQIDRGPETAFVEQLQTDGFRHRYDAFSSGFGSYEQARLARETQGIFFMLPSVESDLVRGSEDKRRYALEAMRPYRPDLRPRDKVIADRDKFPLRTLIWKVVNDLSPYRNNEVVMRMGFSPTAPDYRPQMMTEITRTGPYLNYLAAAQQALEKGRPLREQEADPRWQANYDLMYAQIVAYQARMYEYRVALQEFLKSPQTTPPTKDNLRHVAWDVGTRSETRTKESGPYVERSTDLFNHVAKDHAGTPWAERAKWELARGFGVYLAPEYRAAPITVTSPRPIPKL